MEGAVHRHDVPRGARLARELDRRLARLGAGVAEEDLAAEARPRQALGQTHRGLGVEKIADVHQPPGLLAHGCDHLGMTVPDVRDGDAAEKVEVLVAVDVPQTRALATHELDGLARVGVNYAGILDCLQS